MSRPRLGSELAEVRQQTDFGKATSQLRLGNEPPKGQVGLVRFG